MTLIQCFNNALVENIAVCLELKPDKLFLLGDHLDLEGMKERYEELLHPRDIMTQIETHYIGDDRLSEITKLLTRLVCQESSCVIDLTEADEIPAMAVGAMLMQLEPALRRNVCVLKYDARSDSMITLMGTPAVVEPGAQISVSELIALFGGIVKPRSYQPPKNYTPRQLDNLWKVMRTLGPKRWNKEMSYLLEFESRCKDPMHIRLPLDQELRSSISDFDTKLEALRMLLEDLRNAGIILYREDDDVLDYRYTDSLYQYCTEKVGNTLEIKVLLEARNFRENGVPFFTDCQTSVHIDWDGYVHSREENIPDTNNEIDVVLMHGAVPLFISCKNGDVDEDELYKLHTVAQEFGGPNARKMLVASNLNRKIPSHRALIQRAWDMDIYPVTGFARFRSEDWQETFRNAVL